ncbi:MAG: DUF4874 domain-containing protein, partial [Brevundimonas sp.]
MMRFWLILLAALAAATAVRAQGVQPVTFAPSEADWPNPERGFYRVIGPDLARASEADMAQAYAAGFRLVYVKIDLEPWREGALPESELQALDAAFGRARRAGIKLIVRASYNDPQGETGYRDARDAPLAIVERHLAQLTPVFAANQDVIAVVQAGLIGAWGEWHTSSN